MSTIAVYPGTFDPLTLGHQDLIRRGAGLFGSVIVAVAVAHHKKTLFSLDERLDMVREVVAPLGNVSVLPFNGLVREIASLHGDVAQFVAPTVLARLQAKLASAS